MIRLENVTKIYKAKKGHSTTALNNVSIIFDNKGMTFILGKSGSGKSTLLNVVGGLDRYDSGNITILGKSNKDFKQSDFDSYRNTYVGFVFQEYNLLDDYNVHENIALALQLQQKKIDQKKIESLLEKLDLKDLEYRNVNELSGGQKQRVAIARALIKNPKIILADEPTGNLDSETSKQIMNLFKEISKEKLVIIVSHDTETANNYGDRIIQIKDGNIISDTIKNKISNIELDKYKVIKSKLPFKDSFKLGIGSLKHKKLKLVLTTILIICSLLFLSILDTLSNYDINLAHSKLLSDKDEQFVQIEKSIITESDGYINKELQPLNENDILSIQNKISKNRVFPIFRLKNDYGYDEITETFHILNEFNEGIDTEIVSDNNFNYLSKVTIIGRKPIANNEIVISNYIADLMIKNGIKLDEELYKPKDYQDILNTNKLLPFAKESKIKIVGIINYKLDDYLKVDKKNNENPDSMKQKDFETLSEYQRKKKNIFNKVYVNNDFIDYLNSTETSVINSDYYFQLESDEVSILQEGPVFVPSTLNKDLEYFDGKKWTRTNELKENEIILNINQISDFDINDYRSKLKKYINENLGAEQLELEKSFFEQYIKNYNIIGTTINLNIKDSVRNRANYDNLKIIGITGLITTGDLHFYLSSTILNEYVLKAVPTTGIFILENSQKELKKLMDTFGLKEEISLKSTYNDDVIETIHTVELLKKVSIYVSIVFVIFSAMLISNFIVSSISYRKKEIGILRGLGATNIDVIKIFLWEGIVLATFSFIVTSILLIFVTNLLNMEIVNSGINIILTPFIVTLRQFIVIFLLVYIIVSISSIIPITKISRMKPIDAISNK